MTTIDDIKSWTDGIMKREGVENYELNIQGNGLKGEGYAGDITFVNVKTTANGSKKDYNFAIKSAKKSDKLREQTPIKEIYLREILVYSKIFPAFEQFQLENSIREPFKKYPKCYSVCEEEKKETVVLENLKIEGFELHEKSMPMNLSHVQFVFIQYARLHAVSMAMKQLKPELFKAITKGIDNVFSSFVVKTNMVFGLTEYFKKALKLLDTKEAKKFEGYETEIEKLYIKATYDPDDPMIVILHGDCWNNNMMFKYNKQTDKTKPIDMRLVDFQISQVAHPILDLSNFFYTCCDKEVLKNFDSLLKLYYITLSDCLSEYGVNLDKLFSLAKLREDWKTIGKYGVYMAAMGIQFMYNDDSETFDLEEISENNQVFGESVVTMMKDDVRYDERVGAILKHFSAEFL